MMSAIIAEAQNKDDETIMDQNQTTILADIGGTHVRLAHNADDMFHNAEKFKVADYSDLLSVILAYCETHNLPKSGRVAIGTAAHPDENNVWWFQNLNEWGIDPRALIDAGWEVPVLVNDFVASSCGAVSGPRDKIITLFEGRNILEQGRNAVILGPGTGLGLGYVQDEQNGQWHVQETLGGHMLGSCITDEQIMISRIVCRLRGGSQMFIHEDVVSGVGLPVLYRAVCVLNGMTPVYTTPLDIIKNRNEAMPAQTMRLFHEFFGLYAHNALITGNGFAGIYLDGGLMQNIYQMGAFDFETFYKFLVLKPHEVVEEKIRATPIYLIMDPFVSLHGLRTLVSYHD
jgi:glucokinase